jgi:hypothetical protein
MWTVFISTLLTTGKCVLYSAPLASHLKRVYCISLHSPYNWGVCTVYLSTLFTPKKYIQYSSPLSFHLENYSVLFSTFPILGKFELYFSLFFLYLGGVLYLSPLSLHLCVHCIPIHSPYTWEVCPAFISTCLTVHLESVLYFYPFSLYL